MNRDCVYYTREMIEFISLNKPKMTYKELTPLFNKKYNTHLTDYRLSYVYCKYCVKNEPINTKCSPYTQEETEWTIENHHKYTRRELYAHFIEKFDKPVAQRSYDNFCTKLRTQGLIKDERKCIDRFIYTDEMVNWVLENKSKYSVKDFCLEFEQKFNHKVTYGAIKRMLLNRDIKTSELGIKAIIDSSNMSPYKLGQRILSNINGYEYIKIDNKKHEKRYNQCGPSIEHYNENYMKYDEYLWYQKYGYKLKKDEFIWHKDGNKLNYDFDNMMIVNKNEYISATCSPCREKIEGLNELNILTQRVWKLIGQNSKESK